MSSKFPHLGVSAPPESDRGETWTGAAGQKIKKEGEMMMEWFTDSGRPKKCRFKVGNVGRTLIATSRLNDCEYDAYLTRSRPMLMSQRTGEIIPLRRSGGMYLLNMWVWVPGKTEEGFARQP